ncbi:MAG TPA: M67 family metallopeptidase [Edaphobacter sp.]|jgi:proteasome lid subunit RPN8/RPN11|nr:M67 family metallopeptidase [Edaphobacter sp.]
MLRIGYHDYEALRKHGEETYPHECCGVLLGKNVAKDENSLTPMNHVQHIVRAGNTRTDSAHNRYNIAPQELIKIQRQARGLGLDIIGFYHSHPDHPAQWSTTDFAEAHWLGCSYVITSVEHGKAATTNSFLLTGTEEDNKGFEDEPIEITIATHVTEEVTYNEKG